MAMMTRVVRHLRQHRNKPSKVLFPSQLLDLNKSSIVFQSCNLNWYGESSHQNMHLLSLPKHRSYSTNTQQINNSINKKEYINVDNNNGVFGINALVEKFEENIDDPNDLLREWLMKTQPDSADNAFHDLLHSVLIGKHSKQNSTQIFFKILETKLFGENLRSKILRCGRIIKRARGRDNIGAISQRIPINDMGSSDDSDSPYSSSGVSEFGKLNGSRLVSSLVSWCEEKSDELARDQTVKPHKQEVPFKRQSNYFDSLMYVYCQAGFIFDALSLWTCFIEEFGYKPHRTAVTGLIRLLCFQVIEEGIIDQDINDGYEKVDENALNHLTEILRLIKVSHSVGNSAGVDEIGIDILVNPCAKALDSLIRGVVEDYVEGEEEEAIKENLLDETSLKLDQLLIVVKAFEDVGVPMRRKSYASLLKLCNQNSLQVCHHSSEACFRATDIFHTIKTKAAKANPTLKSSSKSRNNDNVVATSQGFQMKKLQATSPPLPRNTNEFFPPTRHEYCLYVSALNKARAKSLSKYDHSHKVKEYDKMITDIVTEMEALGHLPLIETFLIQKAKLGDLHSLDGALTIKKISGERLGMMLVTKLMTELVSFSSATLEDSETYSASGSSTIELFEEKEEDDIQANFQMKKQNPYLALAWGLWVEFSEHSDDLMGDEEKDPDLRMFNVALTVASKMKDVKLIDNLLFKLTCTPCVNDSSDSGTTQNNSSLVSSTINTANEGEERTTLFLKPDLFTYNILIDAYGRCHHLYKALELFDEMKYNHIQPDVITFNSLAKAYVLEHRLDDAVKVIQEASKLGVATNYITFRTLCHAFGDSNSMLNELHELEATTTQTDFSNENLSKISSTSLHKSSYDLLLKNATVWNQTSDTCNLSLDLHVLNISEAKAKVAQELEYLHQFYREEQHTSKVSSVKDGDDYDGVDVGYEIDAKEAATPTNNLLPDLVLITGVGKHSLKKPNKAAMKHAMIDYLNEEGIVFYEAPGNPGRLIVSSNELKIFFEKFRIRSLHTSYSDYMSLRYMVLPSFLASVLILPKISEFYSHFLN